MSSLSEKLQGLVQSTNDPAALLYVINNLGHGVPQNSRFARLVQILRQDAISRLFMPGQEALSSVVKPQQVRTDNRRQLMEDLQRKRRDTIEDQLQLQLARKQRAMIEDQLVPVMLELQERQLTGQLFQQASLNSHVRKLLTEKPEALRQQLKDDDPLVRLLAVIAVGRRHLHLEEDLVERLKDPQPTVRDAARQALVRVGRGTDFGPVPNATTRQRDAAIQRWREWLAQQETPLSPAADAAQLRAEEDK
jgi:hypothetical protein